MELADRIEELWRVLRADSPEGRLARRRVAATTAMATAVAVLLALVGLLAIVLVVAAVVTSLAAVVIAALLVRRYGARFVGLRGAVSRGTTVSAAAGRSVASGLLRGSSRAGLSARRNIECRVPQVRDSYSRVQAVAGRHLATATGKAQHHARSAATSLAASAGSAWPTRTPGVRQRDAVRANAAGVQLRRQGACNEAAEQHRLALAVFRDLGDRRSEALTLNNLALALDRADDPAALELFEQAATILGELGEEQHEGKVIANLGMAFRRRGREDQSAEVLEVALEKLDPDSQAYRTVERLRRAS